MCGLKVVKAVVPTKCMDNDIEFGQLIAIISFAKHSFSWTNNPHLLVLN